MPYPEIMIRPMREDLTRLGAEELKTVEAVDDTIQNSKGTLMVVVTRSAVVRREKRGPAWRSRFRMRSSLIKSRPSSRVRISRPPKGRAATSRVMGHHRRPSHC